MWNKGINCLYVCILWVIVCTAGVAEAQRCVSRKYEYSSVVCVCNSSYCDSVPPVTDVEITGGSVKHYVSTMAGRRLDPMIMKFGQAQGNSNITLNYSVNRSATYQKILGFGGALTDSAAMNIDLISHEAQENLLRSYFGPEGIGYSFVRVPIGGTDFSTRYYSLDDVVNDTSLTNFNLTEEDCVYKIPYIKRIRSMSPHPIKLFAASWSAPDWMKDIGITIGYSTLKTEYFQLWAEYLAKFLDAYAKEDVTFWGITPQNEPTHGILNHHEFNNMGWTAETQLDWISKYLIPTLQQYNHDINLMLLDDQRPYVKNWTDVQFANEAVRNYAKGIAVHWYADVEDSLSLLDVVHSEYPEKFLLYTEASIMPILNNNRPPVTLGSWVTAQKYLSSIIQVSNHWVSGWVDWNMALNEQGGPTWAENHLDSPIIVNATLNEFYKQPMFYALAHVSSFVPPGSVRIGLETSASTNIESVAFLTPENVTVIILHNTNEDDVSAVINDPQRGNLPVTIPGDSFNTVLYK